MSEFIAALPMYDWPEVRAETDAQWAALSDALRQKGIGAPEQLVRRNADLPPVPGGIRGIDGKVLVPDPATLPPNGLNFHALWLHPALLFAQTCWGPMELGLASHVQVVGQPDYSAFEGGHGELYSSAIVMRKADESACAPTDGLPSIPVERLRGKRFAYNSLDSMSGILAPSRDLEAMGASLDIFSERMESGGHRASVVAVAEGRADVAAIDCRSWDLAKRFEPGAKELTVVGWTGLRKGLPFITSRFIPPPTLAAVREVLASLARGQAAHERSSAGEPA
jgi:ABC-type phosphate/phosphonate transport system substrate-binding protein